MLKKRGHPVVNITQFLQKTFEIIPVWTILLFVTCTTVLVFF